MKPTWVIDSKVKDKFTQLYEKYKNNPLLTERISSNIEKNKIDLSRNTIWKILFGCQITSQQKSGENSPTEKFINSNSQILDYKKCIDKPTSFISNELKQFGIRWNEQIANRMIEILNILEQGEWNNLETQLNKLSTNHSKEDELDVVKYLMKQNPKTNKKMFKGLGPKQSRNFLQWIGLSIYEIPIDSRALKTLEECGCQFIPGYSGLQDEATYEFLEEGMQKLAEEIGIFPCILDAVCFLHFERT